MRRPEVDHVRPKTPVYPNKQDSVIFRQEFGVQSRRNCVKDLDGVCLCVQLLSGLVGWMREDYWLKKK